MHILHSQEKRFQISNCPNKTGPLGEIISNPVDIKLERSLPRRARVIRLLVDVDFCFVRLPNGMPLVYCGFLPNSRLICGKKKTLFQSQVLCVNFLILKPNTFPLVI